MIGQQVKIQQKTITHTPLQKLQDAFINFLAGGHGIVEINRCVKTESSLLVAIFFSGFFLPRYRLAPPVRIISWLLPATYGTAMLQDVMLRDQPPQLLLLLALFAYAAILFLTGWFWLSRQMARK